jgi:hypothetical protein
MKYKQFTIRAMLFAMLCIGGILAGFQFGYFWGGERRRLDTPYAKVYSVVDAIDVDPVSQEPDFDTFISALKSTIEPVGWSDVGGQGSVQVMSKVPPMVSVAQSGKNHDAINGLLSELRTKKQASNATHSPNRDERKSPR